MSTTGGMGKRVCPWPHRLARARQACPCHSHANSMTRSSSDRVSAALAGADADAVLEREDKDFSIANFARLARAAPFDDRRNGRLDKIVVDGDLQLHFAEQIHRDLMPAIKL